VRQKREKLILLFDLDGTLINSIPGLANSINFMLKEMKLINFKI